MAIKSGWKLIGAVVAMAFLLFVFMSVVQGQNNVAFKVLNYVLGALRSFQAA